MWTRSRGLREPFHCALFYYPQAGIQERSTPASPGSTGRRWARQAAWADPGPGQTQPVRRLPEVPWIRGPLGRLRPLGLQRQIAAGNVLLDELEELRRLHPLPLLGQQPE